MIDDNRQKLTCVGCRNFSDPTSMASACNCKKLPCVRASGIVNQPPDLNITLINRKASKAARKGINKWYQNMLTSKGLNQIWLEDVHSLTFFACKNFNNNNNNIIYQYLYRFAWSAENSCYKSRTCVQRKVVKTIIYNLKVS